MWIRLSCVCALSEARRAGWSPSSPPHDGSLCLDLRSRRLVERKPPSRIDVALVDDCPVTVALSR